MELSPDGVALVTGAASGLGAATVRLLAAEGLKAIVLADLDGEGLKEVAEELQELATHPNFLALPITMNVSVEEEVEALFEKIITQFGRLDYAVNNAGIMTKSDFSTFPTAEFDRINSINQRGLFFCMRAEARIMLKQEPLSATKKGRKRDRGVIVNIASAVGLVATPQNAAYIGSKHAVIGYTKSLAIDHAKDGIRVNCVAPGFVWTKIQPKGMDAEALLATIVKSIPVQRTGEAEEIADAVLFLCSPKASYIHGHTLAVDGAALAA